MTAPYAPPMDAQLAADVARAKEASRVAAQAVMDAEAAHQRRPAAVRPIAPAPEPRPVFRLVGPDEIFAPLPDPDFVLGPVPKSSLCLLGAYGSSSKTWQMIDAALSVAAGARWLHRFEVKQGPATILDYESGAYELRRRLQLLARGRGLVGPVRDLDFASMPQAYLGTTSFEANLEPIARDRALIAIDSLRAASTEDENDSRIRRGLDGLRNIGERTGCTFLVLVHSRKENDNTDAREMFRGSSGIFDAADHAFAVSFKKDKERFDVVQTKARTGRGVEPFTVRLVDANGGVRVEGADLPEEERAATSEERFEAVAAKVRAVLRDDPGIGLVALRAKVGGKAVVVDGVIEWLEARGEIVDLGKRREDGTYTTHAYRVAPRGKP